MMRNPLVAGGVILIFAYAVLGLTLPPGWFRIIIAALMAVFAAAAAVLWSEGAFRALREGTVDSPRLAVIGLFLIATGATYASVYSLVFNIAGRPPAWALYPIWPIGQAMTATGFYLVCSSPARTIPSLGAHRFWLSIIGGILLFLSGYLMASAGPDVPSVPDISGYWR